MAGMADRDAESESAARAEHRKKLATYSVARRELIGQAIIDGLINPGDLVSESGGGGGNYVQEGGPYTQNGGGNHWQGGNGGYTQNKNRTIEQLGFDPAELVSKLVIEQIRIAEQFKGRGG